MIFNYIILPENLDIIKNEIKDYNIKFIVLMTDETTILKRDKERKSDCQMGERCITLLKSFKNQKYNMKNVLYTTNLSVDETIKIIEDDERFLLKGNYIKSKDI